MTALADWFGCVRLASATEAEAEARGLFGSAIGYNGIPFYYDESVGFYLIASSRALVPPRYYSPDVENPEPFEVVDQPSCLPRYRPLAERLLQEIADYVKRGHPIDPSDADVLGTPAAFAMRFHEGFSTAAILNCAHLATTTSFDANRRGLKAYALPAINFDSKVGLFVLGGLAGGR